MSVTCDSPSEASSPDAPAANEIAVGGATESQDDDGVTQDVTAKKFDRAHVKDRTPVRWAALEVLVRPCHHISTSPSSSLNSA